MSDETLLPQASSTPAGQAKSDIFARRQFGRFRISSDLVKRHANDLLPLFSQIIVTRCEHDFLHDTFNYSGISPLFEKVDYDVEPPDYEIRVKKEGGKLIFMPVRLSPDSPNKCGISVSSPND